MTVSWDQAYMNLILNPKSLYQEGHYFPNDNRFLVLVVVVVLAPCSLGRDAPLRHHGYRIPPHHSQVHVVYAPKLQRKKHEVRPRLKKIGSHYIFNVCRFEIGKGRGRGIYPWRKGGRDDKSRRSKPAPEIQLYTY